MKKKPENWTSYLTSEVLHTYWGSPDMKKLLDKAQENYVTWDVFRHYPFPKEFSPEQAWALLKITHRMGLETSPVLDKEGKPFTFNPTKALYRRLAHIDTHAAGLIPSLDARTTSTQRDQLIISSLTEEAIASSQIEGANTSRKVAKEMLYSGRKPRTTGEQMIINNYQVMQHLSELKDLDLSEEMLLDIQKRITNKTLENPDDAGRFRVDADQIAVVDHATGEIAHNPPDEDQMRDELKRLIEYANDVASDDNEFVHPFLKATILHFWVGYLHPFVDGNGRTARAIFYWYLLKRNYWLFQYLSISRIIKAAKKKYDDAFLNSETDDNDLTYFMQYKADVACRAIDEMETYLQRKLKEEQEIKATADKLSKFNNRQIAVLKYFKLHKDNLTTIKRHQTVHSVVYETARHDLMELTKRGYLVETQKGRKKIYLPNMVAIKRLLK